MSSRMALAQMGSLNDEPRRFSFMRLSSFLNMSMDTVIVKVNDTNQAAYAKARTSFNRPNRVFPRADEHRETDNLFNALWEAELVAISDIDKIGILGREAL